MIKLSSKDSMKKCLLKREGIFNKLPQVISRILYKAIIYLSQKLPNVIKLPTHHGLRERERVILHPKVTMTYVAFQHARFTPGIHYCIPPGAFTSRFHPYPNKLGRLFSVALSVLVCTRPGCSPVRCSMLSGLSSLITQRDSVLRRY